MLHQMKLQPELFYYMKNGTKRIELRLYDEKRSKVQLGDEIKFLKEPNLDESIKVKVSGLLRYNSFSDLFNDFDISILADKSMTKEDLLETLQKYYTIKNQQKYGVLGIRVEKE
ncbi:MAG: ASCH domain-containing protein [Clostridia bacterium]|nr:ASCH domain-containing protein [Clostridia bacterium]